MRKMMKGSFLGSIAVLALAVPVLARASTPATGLMQVSMTVTAECKLQASSVALSFGSHGVIDSNVDAQTTLGLQCTNSTPYNIALDPGQGSGATVANRAMTGASNAVLTYSVYQDAARSRIWGQTANTDAVASTGTGSLQSFNIYGRVPPQTTPAPGAFSDLVAVTITY